MVRLLDSIHAAVAALRAHALRSVLTTVGIVIGVASVIAVVSIIHGVHYTIGQQLQGLGANSLTVRSFTSLQDQLQGKVARLTPRDLEVMSAQVEGLQAITRLLRRQHALPASQPDDFRIQTPEQLMKTWTSITAILTLAVGGIVAISLVVGGIGIMNMMLVSVTERTRDIGICKAMGATRRHIWWQFLLEAVVLSLAGGLIGIVLGYGAGGHGGQCAARLPGSLGPLVGRWQRL